jgi:hypothetical protein
MLFPNEQYGLQELNNSAADAINDVPIVSATGAITAVMLRGDSLIKTRKRQYRAGYGYMADIRCGIARVCSIWSDCQI